VSRERVEWLRERLRDIDEEIPWLERKLSRDDIPDWQRRFYEERLRDLRALRQVYSRILEGESRSETETG
jgi:hypothetical protein